MFVSKIIEILTDVKAKDLEKRKQSEIDTECLSITSYASSSNIYKHKHGDFIY